MHPDRLVDYLRHGKENFGLDDWAQIHVLASVRADLLLSQHLLPQLLLSDWQNDLQELCIAYLDRTRRLKLVA